MRAACLLFLLACTAPTMELASSFDTGSASAASSHDERLVRVRVAGVPEDLRAYDIVEGSVRDGSLEIIGAPGLVEELRALGYAPELIARPLTDAASIYPGLQVMLDEMKALAEANPTIAKLVDVTELLGTSPTAEGRHLHALVLSDNVTVDEDEPNVLIVGNHHARELNTPVIVMHAMRELIKQPQLLEGHEIWIAPTWNPDGLEYVHGKDEWWRKNRFGGHGVDQNRNYPAMWSTSCSGSTSTFSETYKGASAGSEAETQTMIALYKARHFQKVLDFHSAGREVLAGYLCQSTPLQQYLDGEAKALSTSMGYGGAIRRPSAEGEHQEFALANYGAWAFLIETGDEFQPPFAEAEKEAAQVFPGIVYALSRPLPITGHVRDAVTGAPLSAAIVVKELAYTQGEVNGSGGPFGRFSVAAPAATYTLEVSAPGYQNATVQTTVDMDVLLTPTQE